MGIVEHVERNGGTISTKELKEQKENPHYGLRKAIAEGELVRVKQGVYMVPSELADTMIDIQRIIPGGVLCLYSAWSYYELTTQIPDAYYVAVETHRRVVVPENPRIQVCYWQQKYCKLGTVEADIAGHHVLISDLEKSVCDAVKFRGKIGMDVCTEIVKTYMRRRDKNLTKLMNYATQMRVAKIMTNYIEIQL